MVLPEVSIWASPNLGILGVKFESRLTFEDHVRAIVTRVSKRIGILRLVCGQLGVASLLLCICSPYPWILFSGVGVCCWMSSSASRAPGVFGGQALPWSDFRRHVAALFMLHKVNSNSNHCLFSELTSVAVRARHTWAAAAAHSLKFEVSRCRTSQFTRCVLPVQTRVWNDLPYTVFDTGTLDEFKGAVNRRLLPWVCFFSFSVEHLLEGLRKPFYKQFCFSHLGLCCRF